MIEGDTGIGHPSHQGPKSLQVTRKQGRDQSDAACARQFPQGTATTVGEPLRIGGDTEQANAAHGTVCRYCVHFGRRVIAVRVDRGNENKSVRMCVDDRAGVAVVAAVSTDCLYDNGSRNPRLSDVPEDRIPVNRAIGPPVAPGSRGPTRVASDVG